MKNENDLFCGKLNFDDDASYDSLFADFDALNNPSNILSSETNFISSSENHELNPLSKKRKIIPDNITKMAVALKGIKKTKKHPDSEMRNLGFQNTELKLTNSLTTALGIFFMKDSEKKQEARELTLTFSEINTPFIYEKNTFFATQQKYDELEFILRRTSVNIALHTPPLKRRKCKSSEETVLPVDPELSDVLETLDKIKELTSKRP